MIDDAICPRRLVDETVAAIRKFVHHKPRVAIILGSGLGDITQDIDARASLPYTELPHMPRSTALGHKGRLVCGELGDVPVILMDGRFHLYEGYTVNEISRPIAVLRELGAEMLIITNASGGINPAYRSGQIMVVEDHLNLMTPGVRCASWSEKPLRCGPICNFYDHALIEQTLEVAREQNFVCHRGVYVGVPGPNYETRAEYRAFRRLGGDVVGMSTVPEVIAARHVGLRVLALSMITNVACPDRPEKTTPEEVNRLAALAAPNLRKILSAIVR